MSLKIGGDTAHRNVLQNAQQILVLSDPKSTQNPNVIESNPNPFLRRNTMLSKAKIFTQAALIFMASSRLFAGVDLPVETIKEMADINPVNGNCSLEQVQITDQDGAKSLSMTLKVADRSIPATISLKQAQSQWSESKGTNEARSPFWRFILKDGDSSRAGAITDINWQVEGTDLRTKSLSLQYIDADAATPTAVTCM